MPKADALKLGAMALFGEKYGNTVRVVNIDPAFSIELCGGTHVDHTGMIGVFTIVSESAVAAGVRRIEAITGGTAIRYITDKIVQNKTISFLLKSKDPVKAIEKLLRENTLLEKEVEQLQAQQRSALSKSLAQNAKDIKGIAFIGENIEVSSAAELKKVCFDLNQHLTNHLVVLTAAVNGKAMVAVSIDEKLVEEKGWDAGKMIKQQVAPIIKGGGGGQKTLATAGGKDTSRLNEVIEVIKSNLS